MSELAVPLLLVAVASSLVMLALHAALRIKLRARDEAKAQRTPPISVLKPLKGSDAELYANLAAFAEQRYPAFELVLGTAERDDPALAVARKLRDDYPHVAIRVVTGAPDIGFNPKVSNLAYLACHARHAVLLVSDADVRPDPGYLAAQAQELADDVGLVHSVLCSIDARRAGAVLDALHLNGWIAPLVAAGERFGHACVIGKSMLLRRDELAALGGWESIKDVLAEDYLLGRRVQAAGRRVVQSAHVLTNLSPNRSIRDFWQRHVRWAQMRFRICTTAYLGELLGQPLLWWSLALVSADPSELSSRASLAAVALGAVYGSQATLALRLHARALRPWHVALLPVKDVLILTAWLMGVVKRQVVWRGTRLRIARGSCLSPLELEPRRARRWATSP